MARCLALVPKERTPIISPEANGSLVSDAQTLIREIEEELSVQIIPETIAEFGSFEAPAHGKAEGVSVRMTCLTAEFTGELSPASEIEELAWLTYEDKARVSAVSVMIMDKLREMKLLF